MLAFCRVHLWLQRFVLCLCCRPPQLQTSHREQKRHNWLKNNNTIGHGCIIKWQSFLTILYVPKKSCQWQFGQSKSSSYTSLIPGDSPQSLLQWANIIISQMLSNNYLCVCVICVPRWPKGLLTPDVPHQEMGVVDDDLLHVAPDCRRSVHHLVHWTETYRKTWAAGHKMAKYTP